MALDTNPLGLLTQARLAPGPLLVVGAGLVWYLRAWRRVPGWPVGRVVAWCTGTAVVAVATLSGLASWDQASFAAHGVVDMMVALVAPVFLALGAPLALAGQAGGTRCRLALDRVAAHPLTRVATHPALAWIVFGASLFAQYYLPLFPSARSHQVLLQLGHLELLVAGCLLVWPVVGVDPLPARLGPGRRAASALLMVPFYTVFGMGLDSFTHPAATGVSAADVHVAGDVIWSAGEVIGLAVAVGILGCWLRLDLRATRQAEAVDEENLAMQAAIWRVSRLLAKPEAVQEAERAATVEAGTIPVSGRPAGSPPRRT
ncbi:MAG: cytochrome c oxidase assembly protein [Acidimicrobiales bacterium]